MPTKIIKLPFTNSFLPIVRNVIGSYSNYTKFYISGFSSHLDLSTFKQESRVFSM